MSRNSCTTGSYIRTKSLTDNFLEGRTLPYYYGIRYLTGNTPKRLRENQYQCFGFLSRSSEGPYNHDLIGFMPNKIMTEAIKRHKDYQEAINKYLDAFHKTHLPQYYVRTPKTWEELLSKSTAPLVDATKYGGGQCIGLLSMFRHIQYGPIAILRAGTMHDYGVSPMGILLLSSMVGVAPYSKLGAMTNGSACTLGETHPQQYNKLDANLYKFISPQKSRQEVLRTKKTTYGTRDLLGEVKPTKAQVASFDKILYAAAQIGDVVGALYSAVGMSRANIYKSGGQNKYIQKEVSKEHVLMLDKYFLDGDMALTKAVSSAPTRRTATKKWKTPRWMTGYTFPQLPPQGTSVTGYDGYASLEEAEAWATYAARHYLHTKYRDRRPVKGKDTAQWRFNYREHSKLLVVTY